MDEYYNFKKRFQPDNIFNLLLRYILVAGRFLLTSFYLHFSLDLKEGIFFLKMYYNLGMPRKGESTGHVFILLDLKVPVITNLIH